MEYVVQLDKAAKSGNNRTSSHGVAVELCVVLVVTLGHPSFPTGLIRSYVSYCYRIVTGFSLA